jgi:hypothetical protein
MICNNKKILVIKGIINYQKIFLYDEYCLKKISYESIREKNIKSDQSFYPHI